MQSARDGAPSPRVVDPGGQGSHRKAGSGLDMNFPCGHGMQTGPVPVLWPYPGVQMVQFVAPAAVVVHPVEQCLQGGWGTVRFPPKLYQPTVQVLQFAPPRPGAQTCNLQSDTFSDPCLLVVRLAGQGRQGSRAGGDGTDLLAGLKLPTGQRTHMPRARP